jgi:hypothetical protein
LAEEAWEAIQEWLAASGRLEGMEADSYIFAPLASPMQAEASDQGEAWVEGRALSSSAILDSLKLYGRRVGIADEKLTLMALRRTATRLRMEAGDDLEEMQAFLDSREGARFTKYRLRQLPELPADAGRDWGEAEEEAAIPVRRPRPFQPGEGVKHGLYAQNQPREEVRAVLRENIQGVEEEIGGLRSLCRGLLEMEGESHHSREMAQLAEAYTLTARRLAVVIDGEKKLYRSDKARWVEDFLAGMDKAAQAMGHPPVSERAREEVKRRGNDSGMELVGRRLVEETAATRYVLRKTLGLAREAWRRGERGEFIHLADIYSMGCNRLIRLLRTEGAGQEQLAAFLEEQIQRAIGEVWEEWGVVGTRD